MTLDEFLEELAACKDDFTWVPIDTEEDELPYLWGRREGKTYCPITAVLWKRTGERRPMGDVLLDGPKILGLSKEDVRMIINAADGVPGLPPDVRRDLCRVLGITETFETRPR